MQLLDFSSSILNDLTEEQIIQIYLEIQKKKKEKIDTQNINKKTLLYEVAYKLNQLTFKNTLEQEIIRVELYTTMKLAEKYMENYFLDK